MSATASDARLPFELISKILDHVTLSELVWLSHVCRVWRRAAHAHLIFWRDIKLPLALTPAALDLFRSRLYAHSSGVNLDVACLDYGLPDHDYTRQFRSVVLPAIQCNLCRTLRLRIECTDNLSSIVFGALMEPAPVLQDLFLVSLPNDFPGLILPENFLGGYAPRLRRAFLGEIALPGRARTVAAFQNVESLQFKSQQDFALVDLLAHFPALRQLRVSAFSFIEDDAPLSFARGPLVALDVHAGYGNYGPFFSAFRQSDLQAVTHFTCPAYGPDDGWIHTLVSAIAGQLTLTVRDFGTSDVSVELSSPDPAQTRTRTFHIDQMYAQGEEDEAWSRVQEELFNPDLLARVTRFRLLSRNSGIVPEIGDELPACEILELYFDGRESLHDHPLIAVLGYNRFREPYALQLPAVRTVICAPSEDSPAGVTIAADELSVLLARVIRARPSPLKLIELAGVQLTGDIKAVEHEYGCAVVQRSI